MTLRNWPASVIRKTPVTPSGSFDNSSASGVWTIDEAAYWESINQWPSQSNPSPDKFIENLFSTYLYTGNGSTQTITTGIDLAGKGGMLWIKSRSLATNNIINDTARGAGNNLMSNSSSAQFFNTDNVSALSSTGFSVGVDSNTNGTAGATYVSWTFRKQPKFFDVVTYTGNGSNRAISHNLGSVPGCIIVKRTDSAADWQVYHRSLANTEYMVLNSTAAKATGTTRWNSTTPTSTVFSLGTDTTVNASGGTYVAYLFAHDAGGFGLTGTDNVISCGSVTADGSGNATVNLGYEPQWILIKSSSETNNWAIVDTMRGLPADGSDRFLFANSSAAESGGGLVNINATGFYANATLSASATYIYIAIRRGPMRTPTSGTSVFSPIVISGATGNGTGTTNFPVDLSINSQTTGSTYKAVFDRMRQFRTNNGGTSQFLYTNDTSAETTSTTSYGLSLDSNTSFTSVALWNGSTSAIYWNFRRAPGFFDVVCYTGNGTGSRALSHNLGVAPEMVIVKQRTAVGPARSWWVLTTSGPRLNILNDNSAANAFGVPANLFGDATYNNYIAPTSTTVTLSPSDEVNNSSNTYVMYLFASCPGVSKVGSYTGTGALQTVNCGFTGGARFVLIKRTDTTGDWYVYDSARGISASNDPYLFLNSTAAEVTGTNYVDTDTTGFKVTAAAPAGLNANGGTYIFLAIA